MTGRGSGTNISHPGADWVGAKDRLIRLGGAPRTAWAAKSHGGRAWPGLALEVVRPQEPPDEVGKPVEEGVGVGGSRAVLGDRGRRLGRP